MSSIEMEPLTGYEVIRSPATGIFQASVRDGYAIAKNGLLGQLVDAFGHKITDLRASPMRNCRFR
jgi:hypothetical protein